jgi:transcription antitermination factor NusG
MADNWSELSPDRSERWFALRVRSRCEKKVELMARGKGIETFLPLYNSRRRWSDRYKSVVLPMFPGYIFCRLDPNRRFLLMTVPGVVHFVGLGKTPVPIDESEIAALQLTMRSGLPAEPYPFLEVGQRVRLETGPLSGLEGIFLGDSNKDRIVVSITLLRRSVATTIERYWAAPLTSPAAALNRV